MPVSAKLLQGPSANAKKFRIKNGAVVQLDGDFETGSGVTYAKGTRGKKVGDYPFGWEVSMPDGVTISVPAHLHAPIVVQGE